MTNDVFGSFESTVVRAFGRRGRRLRQVKSKQGKGTRRQEKQPTKYGKSPDGPPCRKGAYCSYATPLRLVGGCFREFYPTRR